MRIDDIMDCPFCGASVQRNKNWDHPYFMHKTGCYFDKHSLHITFIWDRATKKA